LIPSTLVTVGVLGFLVWIMMFTLLSYEGYRSIFLATQAKNWNFFLLTSFVSTLYLWVLAIVYPPNMVILSLTFIFSGILLAAGVASETLKLVVIDFSKNPKVGFVSTFLVVVISALVLVFGYFQALSVVAEVQLQRGAALVSGGKLSEGQTAIASAASLSGKDFYFRSLAETEILKMQALFNTQGLSEDAARSEFQNILSAAINYASQAINYDPTNYANWVSLGGVYETIVPLKIDGAYEEALDAYKEALLRNPQNPAIHLLMARLEATMGSPDKAKEEIRQALTLKNNYTEAIFLLSQIEVSEGRLSQAIQSVEAAALISPNDPVVFFQLGLLRYNAEDYAGAASSLERAVTLNSFYSNAKYFLGLSYDKLGRRADARRQFEDIAALNPDNAEIKLILSNIKAGRALFADALPPVDDSPEDRGELPIDE
jgi:tetratricopeptide (TPR) repeat protein